MNQARNILDVAQAISGTAEGSELQQWSEDFLWSVFENAAQLFFDEERFRQLPSPIQDEYLAVLADVLERMPAPALARKFRGAQSPAEQRLIETIFEPDAGLHLVQ